MCSPKGIPLSKKGKPMGERRIGIVSNGIASALEIRGEELAHALQRLSGGEVVLLRDTSLFPSCDVLMWPLPLRRSHWGHLVSLIESYHDYPSILLLPPTLSPPLPAPSCIETKGKSAEVIAREALSLLDRGEILRLGDPPLWKIIISLVASTIPDDHYYDLLDVVRRTLPYINIAFYRGRLDWSVEFLSEGAKDITGYDPQEFTSGKKHWREVIVPADLARISRQLAEAVAHRKRHYLREYRISLADGTVKWISDRGICEYHPDGTPRYLHGVILDVTREKTLLSLIENAKREWEATFDAIPNLISVVDVEEGQYTIRRVNRAFADYFGVHPRDLVGKRCYLLWGHETACHGNIHAHHHTSSNPTVEEVFDGRSGRHFQRICSPFFNERRELTRIICLYTDIGKIKKSEEMASSLARELTFVTETISVIIIAIDEYGVIFRWNRTAEDVFHVPASQALGKSLEEIGLTEIAHIVRESLVACRDRGETVKIPEVHFSPEGTHTRVLDLTIKPFYRANTVLTFFIIGIEITDRKNLEMMLVHSQKLESMGALAAGIAHEINTPSQCLLSNLSFLQEAMNSLIPLLTQVENTHHGDPTLHEIVRHLDIPFLIEEIPQTIAQSLLCLDRIVRIVQAIREFSHPGSNEKMLTDVHKLLESTITISKNEWKYVADIVTSFDTSLPPIFCYPSELSQVFLNIVVNAAQAIRETRGDSPTQKGLITITTRRHNSWFEIRIADTGSGIPKAIQGKVFEPFFTTKQVGHGTGQGLAIAQAIIMKKHHGHIYFETEEGKGTTFVVLLPLSDVDVIEQNFTTLKRGE